MQLIARLEQHLTFRDKDTGELRAIEVENGHLERYICARSTNKASHELFEADKINQL